MTNELNDSTQIVSIKLRGRMFSENDLNIIKRSVQDNYDKGKTQISKIICEELGWKQPNGWLKDRACRDVLKKLDEMKIIHLPPSQITKKSDKKQQKQSNVNHLSGYDLSSPINTFPKSINLEFAKGNDLEEVWNGLVEQYHYLGHNVIVGRCIKYLVKTDDTLLGAIAFSSPAWRITPRDKVLKAIGITEIRDYTINNSRFLILPHVQIPNLASYLLALATKKIVDDWVWYYAIEPLVVETFVQPSLYYGTCYKAANWLEFGITKGYAKRGQTYRNSQEPKKVFLFGLNKQIRRQLRQVFMEMRHDNI